MAQNQAKYSSQSRAFRRVFSRSAVCLSVLSLLLISCGDASIVSVDGYHDRAQMISLVPKFSLNGAEDMPETVYFSELGLSIAEIRLEPLAASSEDVEKSSIIYTTRNAIRLDYDVARGESVIFGEPLEIPHSGRYLISVRLEPAARVQTSPGGIHEVVDPSFRVEGFVASSDPTRTERGRLEESSDGSPRPIPLKELDNPEDCWTPFHYDSRRSVFISLNEVEIDSDGEFLSFEFDMNKWAESLATPLRDAVQHDDGLPKSPTNTNGVDVTSRLEDGGHGAETLLNSARVRSLSQRH